MTCPYCGRDGYDRVVQTFHLPEGNRRRKKCGNCGKLFHTEERVIKHDESGNVQGRKSNV